MEDFTNVPVKMGQCSQEQFQMAISHAVVSILLACYSFVYNIVAPDINECTQTPGICGLGTCSNNDGTFYECSCQNGAMISGSNSNGSLTCVGKYCSTTYSNQ